MAAIVDEIYYGCKTKYMEKCVKHGIKIIELIELENFRARVCLYISRHTSFLVS